MRFWIPLLVAATIAGAFWLAVADGTTTDNKLPARVTRLEKQVKSLRLDVASLEGQVHQAQADLLTAAQAEDGLRVRVEKLEQTVYHQGNP